MNKTRGKRNYERMKDIEIKLAGRNKDTKDTEGVRLKKHNIKE